MKSSGKYYIYGLNKYDFNFATPLVENLEHILPKTLEALSIVPIERIYILVNPLTSPLAYFSSITHLSVFDSMPDLLDALLITHRTCACP